VLFSDQDECLTRDVCGDGTCANTEGSFKCTCNNGFEPGPQEICEGSYNKQFDYFIFELYLIFYYSLSRSSDIILQVKSKTNLHIGVD
jgi:hypothetical protein